MSEPSLPYGRQWVDATDVASVEDVLWSDWLTTGPAVGRFEEALQEATGTRRAVAVSSGTAALHAMYFGAGIGQGDEIVTSPLTFAATANAALYLGATVRFADVAPDTGNLDSASANACVTDRTRAIVAIDFAGHPADYAALQRVADDHETSLLADSAHSLGGAYQGRCVGTLAAASVLSFHPVKAITTGEGGAVVTDDDDLADRVERFRTHGMRRDPARAAAEGPWFHEQVDLGFNYRLSDMQAALGTSQLRRLGPFLARRRAIAAKYTAALGEIHGLELPVQHDDVVHGWHLYVIRVREAPRRRALFERLHLLGLRVQVHYIPTYWHPYYRELGYRRGLCPVAEDFYARAISLPIFPRMTDGEVEFSIEQVHRAARETL
jgi:UDP-4-amino-4,6-dideoxy-N-acetyl-beta-L-altrosamine transaminase